MFTLDKQRVRDGNCDLSPLSRRGMLGVSFSAALGSLAMAGPLAAAPRVSGIQFGDQFVVRSVYQRGSQTHVDLGFRINGRSFTTRLQSIDGRTWRPV